MEEQIKNTVSKYTKIPAGQITASTIIDRSAVASSIILHRMYAQLANEGVTVNDYTGIKTFGQLMANVSAKNIADPAAEPVQPALVPPLINAAGLSVGIDIENISAMPQANDFREDNFYKMNFAPPEIAYCILQPSPYASFAGLFAAKEAIVKADNSYKARTFNTIIIDHLPGGKPAFPGFEISVAHTNDTAIAVAVKNAAIPPQLPTAPSDFPLSLFLSAIAFILSLAALILFFVNG